MTIYARADTVMKRKALEKAYPEMVAANLPHWEKMKPCSHGWLVCSD
jgi:hypothetical protein